MTSRLSPDAQRRRTRRARGGFTLIEIMSAVFLTAIVMALAVSFQVTLGDATAAARERLRYQRHAVGLIDRVGRDLQGAYFIAKPESIDQFEHPWIFVAEHLGGGATLSSKANAVKFITRNYQPQGFSKHASDIATMAYFLDKVEDESGFRLVRWRDPRIAPEFDRDFPSPEDPLSDVVGEGIASFEMSFIDSNGGQVNVWDSTLREGFDSIPLAVRIEIAMINPDAEREQPAEEIDPDDIDEEPREEDLHRFAKTIFLPMRPLDWLVLEQEAVEAADDAGELPDEDDEEYDDDEGDEDDDADAELDDDEDGNERDEDEGDLQSRSTPDASSPALAGLKNAPERTHS